MTTMNRTLVFAGVVTLVQAIGQIFFTAFCIAQYYCVIDFFREIPIIIFLRILYLHNPTACGSTVNIGQALDNVPTPAFVLLTKEPFTSTRTFYINCVYLGLCGLWMLFSVVIILGGAKAKSSKHVRWPWVMLTSLVTVLDVVAVVTYANDSFHTRTLSAMLNYVGGTVSGIGNTEINTALVSWTMVFIYSRLGLIFALNLCLIITIIVECGLIRNKGDEPPVTAVVQIRTADESIQVETTSIPEDVEQASIHSVLPAIPRVGLSHSFRRMKEFLFKKPSGSVQHSANSVPATPEARMRVVNTQATSTDDVDKKRSVNFPVNLLSLPQRLENMIAEQQRRLDASVVDTAGRRGARASQSLPQLDTAPQEVPTTDLMRRRGTAELQGQLPWAYIPASGQLGRDQVPPGEDLPPVPLPDYTAIQPYRKASVHRATSSLSSLTRKRDYQSGISKQTKDVLY